MWMSLFSTESLFILVIISTNITTDGGLNERSYKCVGAFTQKFKTELNRTRYLRYQHRSLERSSIWLMWDTDSIAAYLNETSFRIIWNPVKPKARLYLFKSCGTWFSICRIAFLFTCSDRFLCGASILRKKTTWSNGTMTWLSRLSIRFVVGSKAICRWTWMLCRSNLYVGRTDSLLIKGWKQLKTKLSVKAWINLFRFCFNHPL